MFQLQFNISRLRFQFCALEPINLPTFSGSTWRGALGQALRRVTCIYRDISCGNCTMQSICWYARLYEPIVTENFTQLHGFYHAPHPLIPEPWPVGGVLQQKSIVNLDLILIGSTQEAVPFLVLAVQRMIAYGIGRKRGRLELIHWELDDATDDVADPWQPPAFSSQVTMYVNTPLRLQVNKQILDPHTLELRPLLTALLRRISLFVYFQHNKPMDIDVKQLATIAVKANIVTRQLEWFSWNRYSSTQQRYVAMDGVIGTLTLDLSQCQAWWPYLWVGQWLHVGKGASMGMGRYTLQP